MPRDSFAIHTYAWQKLVDGFTAQDADAFPHFATAKAELEAALDEAKAMKAQLETLNGEARLMARRLRDHIESGKRLEARLRSTLKGAFGDTSEQLIRFGMSPRRTHRRRRTPAEPPAERA